MPLHAGRFRFGDGAGYVWWRAYLWPIPADGGRLGAGFFPEGSPGLRRLSEAEAAEAWRGFIEEARSRAAAPEGCCRDRAREVVEIEDAKEETR